MTEQNQLAEQEREQREQQQREREEREQRYKEQREQYEKQERERQQREQQEHERGQREREQVQPQQTRRPPEPTPQPKEPPKQSAFTQALGCPSGSEPDCDAVNRQLKDAGINASFDSVDDILRTVVMVAPVILDVLRTFVQKR
jgi:hypothetical protein